MKLFCYVHMWPPLHCAGSEVTVHSAMREMVKRGHEVLTIADRTPEPYEYEGVKVINLPLRNGQQAAREYAKDADILITHLDCTHPAIQLSLDLKKPLVHFSHNHAQLGYWHVDPVSQAALVVFNSEWIAKNEKFKGEPWPGKSIVMHPIIEPDKYKCERGTKITFCNPTEGKGVHTVHKLAESMPDYEFLIVEGIYGEQIAPPHLNEEWEARHPNIEHMRNDPDFRNVLCKTKVLLMPSNYESYGRCAVEAACAGIPSIVHPTQGLWEALGDGREYPAETEYGINGVSVVSREIFKPGTFDGGIINGAAIFCDRADTESWKVQLERLYSDEVYYRSRVDAALKLANSLDPEAEFDRLEEALLVTASNWKNKENDKMNKMWTSDRRLFKRADGSITTNKNEAQSLYVGEGGQIPEEEAVKLGLMSRPAETTEVLLDTKAITSPAENKAIQAPEAIKGRKTRKTA